jgi:hypothetical protein
VAAVPHRDAVAFLPTQARFVRITETAPAKTNEQWAIAAVRIYRVGSR